MSIVKIRDWFSPDDAAIFLSSELEAKVTVADIFQLVLDDRLAINVAIINPIPMLSGEVISSVGEGQATSKHLYPVWKNEHVNSLRCMDIHQPLNTNLLFKFGTNISEQTGVFEVQMVGPARQLIQHERQKVMQGVGVTVPMLPIILKASDGKFYALYSLYRPSRYTTDPKAFVTGQIEAQGKLTRMQEGTECQNKIDDAFLDYFSAFEEQFVIDMGFPEDSSLVIKTSDLVSFVSKVTSPQNQSEDSEGALILIQTLANEIAAEFILAKCRSPTKSKVAKTIYDDHRYMKRNGTPLSLETIERRIKVTW